MSETEVENKQEQPSTETKVDEAYLVKYTGNFLDAGDIDEGKKITVTITEVFPPGTQKDSQKRLIKKRIIGFKGAKKRMILCGCNEQIIAMIHGANSKEWIGKTITLMRRYLESAFNEKNVPVVRVVAPDEAKLKYAMRKHYGKPVPFRGDE